MRPCHPKMDFTRGVESQRVTGAALLRRAILGVGLLLLGASLSACGGAGGLGAAGKFTPRTPDTLTVATAQVPDPGFWSGTVQRPTGGFEYGLAQALAARFGLAKIHVIEVPFRQLVAGDLGGADLALSDITVTAERSSRVAFSTSYLSAPPAILVRPGTEVPDVHSAQGLRWAVETGTTLQSALAEAIEPSTPAQILNHQREALLALRVGRASAVMLDLPVALAYARESPHTYAVAAQLPSEAVLAAALPKGSENLEAVDSAMRALSADGTIERLGREWLHTDLQDGRAEEVPVLRTDE
jgi:polar amino acid transport system substrate-binding protein